MFQPNQKHGQRPASRRRIIYNVFNFPETTMYSKETWFLRVPAHQIVPPNAPFKAVGLDQARSEIDQQVARLRCGFSRWLCLFLGSSLRSCHPKGLPGRSMKKRAKSPWPKQFSNCRWQCFFFREVGSKVFAPLSRQPNPSGGRWASGGLAPKSRTGIPSTCHVSSAVLGPRACWMLWSMKLWVNDN